MTRPSGRAAVNVPELVSHARSVVEMQVPLDRVVAAAKVVTPDGFDLAYGLYCQPFALALRPFRESAEDTVGKVLRSVEATSDQLIKTVDTYDGAETGNARMLTAVGANLSEEKNWVVTDGAKFDLGRYNPTEGGAWADMSKENWAKGGGIVGDVWDLGVEIADKNKRNYGTMVGHLASIGLNGVGLYGDPVAAIAGWGTTWMLDHFKPLKLILDVQAGNPEMVKAASRTWKTMGEELHRLGKHYSDAVGRGTGGWNGVAGTAYRERTAKNIIDVLQASGSLARTMSIVVGSTGELVNLVRSATRDIIGEAVGTLASTVVQRFLPYKPPQDGLAEIAQAARKCKKLLEFMVTLLGELGPLFGLLLEAYKAITAIVPLLDGV